MTSAALHHAIWWHVYPLGFCGAPIRDVDPQQAAAPRLNLLIDWLDYAQDLGVNGLIVGPLFASATHGYDTLDYTRIDPRLGGDAEFGRLVTAAHERGMAVVLDGVFNHVSARHPAYLQAVADGPGAPSGAVFRLNWRDGKPEPHVFEGHFDLVELALDGEPARCLVVDAMNHWLDRGIAGWRLDAAYRAAPADWAPIVAAVRERHPQALFLGEVIHGDYADYVQAGGLDSVTQYELWKAIWSAISDRNFYELSHALQRHEALLETFTPWTFTGNHDVTRLAQKIGTDALPLAVAVLMTIGGSPSIYYGDEQGFRGVKEDRPGGDDAVRPAFPARPAELASYGWPIYHLHQDLIGLRRRHPWLVGARTTTVHLANELFCYRSVAPEDPAAWLETTLDLRGGPAVSVRGPQGTLFDYRSSAATTADSSTLQ